MKYHNRNNQPLFLVVTDPLLGTCTRTVYPYYVIFKEVSETILKSKWETWKRQKNFQTWCKKNRINTTHIQLLLWLTTLELWVHLAAMIQVSRFDSCRNAKVLPDFIHNVLLISPLILNQFWNLKHQVKVCNLY